MTGRGRGASRRTSRKTAGKRGSKRAAGKRSRRRRERVGSARRRLIVFVAALTIPAGLLISVRRSAEGTQLATTLADLRQETRLLEEALADEVVRVDSLSSRERIGRVARRMGLRQAEDQEVVILSDVTRTSNVEGGGS